ncbi:MAG: hypothetical protein PHX80_04160 [Candidatus Nanoarchaeia archaeon]|nr:hypothetical protein [Candidatus Nanoarchaeia archaeon]
MIRISIEELGAMHAVITNPHVDKKQKIIIEELRRYYADKKDRFIGLCFGSTFMQTIELNKHLLQLYQKTPADSCVRRIL